MTLPITLAIFARNNEDSIGICIASVIDYVSEIIVVNTGSSDATVAIAESFGARVYHVGFTDFGSIRTLTAHLASLPWVLGLDTDEIICPEELDKLKTLIETPGVEAWGLPRRRWLDIGRKNHVE
jgi:glycosyltransferase involved in cell wall biosynthesis